MSHQRLFHHPVSAMQAPARWYLAGVGMIALILVAVHFAIQVQAQERAQVLVDRWMQQSGMQVEHVRYHLLRNALRLSKMAIHRHGLDIEIGQALVQADPESLTGKDPKLRRVVLSSVRAAVRLDSPMPAWMSDPLLARFATGARSLTASGEIVIRPLAGKPQHFDVKHFHLANGRDGLRVTADATRGDAVAYFDWHADSNHSDDAGRLAWYRLDVDALFSAWGLPGAGEGRLDGKMSWRRDVRSGGYALNGETVWPEGAKRDRQLKWQGRVDTKGWQLGLQAERWPLAPWHGALPNLSGQGVASAVLTATAAIEGRWVGRTWHFSSPQGELDGVILRSDQNPAGLDWSIGSVRYEKLDVWSDRQLVMASSIAVGQAEAHLRPFTQPEKAASTAWRCDFHKVRFDDLTLRVRLPRGELLLPPMSGVADWRSSGAITMALTEQGAETPSWSIKGVATAHGGMVDDVALRIRAMDLPIGQLRPLLPIVPVEQADLPVALSGSAGFNLDAIYKDHAWKVGGSAHADNVSMAYAGEEWSAEKLMLNIAEAGGGMDVQHVRSLDVDGWRYIAPMQPLGDYGAEAEGAAAPAWWQQALHKGGWLFDQVRFTDGEVSIGRTDLRWAKDVSLTMQHVGGAEPGEVEAHAVLGGGDLTVHGKLNALQSPFRFVGSAVLKDAQPFFLGDWLHASGAPRLIRGRMDAELQVTDSDDDHYHVSATWRLRRPLIESGAFPDDPLLQRIGFRTSDALARLSDASGIVKLAVQFDGAWPEQPLTLDRLGEQMLSSMATDIQRGSAEFAATSTLANPVDARIRMHENGGLTHNERVRLRAVWRQLMAHRKWSVEMVPRLPSGDIDDALVRRTRFTQNLIEDFFVKRGIPHARIFAVWPLPMHQVGEVGGIQVLAGAPQ